ncbi:hypothetical protein ACN4EG_13535 [Alkalinema pantanalense CENA528]|uniref:hypothetical protein n=1 Tax=Alkalinema pantanalense TaxID=1620705 RepID=UPI003D6E32A3
MEPIATISLFLATPIAKVILDKFYEGVGSKLGEMVVEKLPGAVKEKIQTLGQMVWGKCLQRASDPTQAQKLLEAAAQGDENANRNLVQGVNQVLEADAEFKKAVEQIAAEIHQQINIGEMNGGEVWNVFGGKAEKNEFTDNKAPIIKDNTGTITFNYGVKPD